ncbi:TrbG/VirB9 family P-type conjugative transfer protein [Metapseudomonas otitidis]|uniref:TrbG/VirB9 family P-type conjugative transfer protein n=1 Tax=Metapseudomonas otitidis TaxID=319939 RepID=UPI000D1A4770|nr:TrbG/VirB9 family P-type conjugative transfer protein [Pseudomonas otitidis]
MKLLRYMVVLLALVSSVQAHAESVPPKGLADPRVRSVDYDAEQVVRITAFFGVSTHIQFGEGEQITDVASGDLSAWELLPRSDNHLFIKPLTAEHPETNLTVLTNKRAYQFILILNKRPIEEADAWMDANVTFSLKFRYPDEELAKLIATQHAAADKANRDDIKKRLKNARNFEGNTDYWVAGALEVSPTFVRDNGNSMRLEFANNRDMPVAYEQLPSGEEKIIRRSVEGNTLVIHRVYRKIILRKGEFVACLVNKSFDLDGGADNTTGTVAPDVRRELKGAE